ncbi:hypothetical protein WDW37_19665 [Bdellovibrionota bacterium FG-1]
MTRWLFLACLLMASSGFANETEKCMKCHADPKIIGTRSNYPYIDPELFAATTHSTQGCTSCHVEVTGQHPDDGPTV